MTDDSSEVRSRSRDGSALGWTGSNPDPNPTAEIGPARSESGGRPDGGQPSSPFPLALERLKRDPVLLLPFAVAGLCLSLLDWVRRHDPLPTMAAEHDGASITVAYTGYPTGVPETARALQGLIDLKLPYLVWGIGLELVAVFAVAAAGTVTIAHALSDDRGETTARRLFAYLGLVVLFDAAFRLVSSFVGGDVGLVFGIVLIVPLFVIFVRFFAAPAFVVTGSGPVTALWQSARATRGHGWTLLALVLCFGLGAWLLGRVPWAGTALSTAVVGSLHAVSVATVWEEIREPRDRGR